MPGEAELRSYDPTWRDRIAQALLGQGRPSPDRRAMVSGLLGSAGLGSTGMGVADLTPLGVPFAAQEAKRDYQAGDYVGATINAMGVIPAVKLPSLAAKTATSDAIRALEKYRPHDARLPYFRDPSMYDADAQRIADAAVKNYGMTADEAAKWGAENVAKTRQVYEAGIPNLIAASQLADAAKEKGVRPIIDWASEGSAYVNFVEPNLLKSGKVSKRAPEKYVEIGDRSFADRQDMKVRFADHAPYYPATVSIDPVSGNTAADALALLDWVRGGKVGPHPQIMGARINPGSDSIGKQTGAKSFYAGLGAIPAMGALYGIGPEIAPEGFDQ